jgi:uncharacterized membrane protein
MRYEKVVTISAPADTVWDVLTDLEAWPEMTASMTSVERVEPGPIKVGARVRIKQPKLPPMEWTVTEVVAGQRFVWEATTPGARTSAAHTLLELPGETTLRLEIEQHGPMSGLMGLVFRGMTHRYLDWETQGFKSRAEGLSS